jgi:hypothetical protein
MMVPGGMMLVRFKVRKVRLAHKDLKVFTGRSVPPDLLVLRVPRVRLARKVPRGHKDLPVRKASKDHRD